MSASPDVMVGMSNELIEANFAETTAFACSQAKNPGED
jgi:hypothetical protein